MERSGKQTYETEKKAVLFFEPSILTKRLKQDSLFEESYLKERFILEITKAANQLILYTG